jgi:hypothetical protein
MIGVAKRAASKTAELLGAPLGIRAAIAGLSQSEGVALAPVENRQILAQNVSAELAERALEPELCTASIPNGGRARLISPRAE